MPEVWDKISPYVGLALVAGIVVAVTFHFVTMFVILTCVFFALALYVIGEGSSYEAAEWEKRYAAMTDAQKIEYHLDVARRYHSNVDANIAQALIERNR